jgi:hypothetical protein
MMRKQASSSRAHGQVCGILIFDVTISPLGFIALGVCDPLSPADPVISWLDAEGTRHDVELDGDAGRITAGFAGIWQEVGASRGLLVPDPIWFEDDPSSSERRLQPARRCCPASRTTSARSTMAATVTAGSTTT